MKYFLLSLPWENKEQEALGLFFMPRAGLDPGHIKFQAGRLGLSDSFSCSK